MTAFDRTAHCQRIAHSGGHATLTKYGRMHFATLGQAGARATIDRHGYATFAGIVAAKGWTPRQDAGQQLALDLAFGQELARLAA